MIVNSSFIRGLPKVTRNRRRDNNCTQIPRRSRLFLHKYFTRMYNYPNIALILQNWNIHICTRRSHVDRHDKSINDSTWTFGAAPIFWNDRVPRSSARRKCRSLPLVLRRAPRSCRRSLSCWACGLSLSPSSRVWHAPRPSERSIRSPRLRHWLLRPILKSSASTERESVF